MMISTSPGLGIAGSKIFKSERLLKGSVGSPRLVRTVCSKRILVSWLYIVAWGWFSLSYDDVSIQGVKVNKSDLLKCSTCTR